MNVTWGAGSWRRWKNPVSAEWCDLCGTKVGADRLIQSDSQGLDGAFICDLHPNERQVRYNPSFLDYGGVSQAPDPVPNWYPHSGVDGFDSFIVELADRLPDTGGDPIVVPGFTFDVEARKIYAVKVTGTVGGSPLQSFDVGIGGTAVASRFSGAASQGSVTVALTAIGTLASFVNLGGTALSVTATIAVSVSGTLTLVYSTSDMDLNTCIMMVGEVDA